MGPMTSLLVAELHAAGKVHKKKLEEQGCRDLRKSLPAYVCELQAGKFQCMLCTVSTTALQPMLMHLGGEKHARTCRSGGHPEIVYRKELNRLEFR